MWMYILGNQECATSSPQRLQNVPLFHLVMNFSLRNLEKGEPPLGRKYTGGIVKITPETSYHIKSVTFNILFKNIRLVKMVLQSFSKKKKYQLLFEL